MVSLDAKGEQGFGGHARTQVLALGNFAHGGAGLGAGEDLPALDVMPGQPVSEGRGAFRAAVGGVFHSQAVSGDAYSEVISGNEDRHARGDATTTSEPHPYKPKTFLTAIPVSSPVFLFVVPHAALPLQAVGVVEHLWPAFQQHEAFGMAVGRAVAYQFPWAARAERALAVVQLLYADSQTKPIAAVQRFGGDKPVPPAVQACGWWTGSTNIAGLLRDAAPHFGISQVLAGEALKAAVVADRKLLREGGSAAAPLPPARSKFRKVGWSIEPVKAQLAHFDREVLGQLGKAFDGLQLQVVDGARIARLKGAVRPEALAQARALVDGMRRLVVWAPYGQALRPIRGQGLRMRPTGDESPALLELEIQWPGEAAVDAEADPREAAVQQILGVLAQLPTLRSLLNGDG